MNRVILTIVATAVLGIGGMSAQETKFGSDLKLKQAIPLAELKKNPAEYAKKVVLIEGEITDVCQKMGCWIRVADSSSTDAILFKVEDGVIEFPTSCKGKKVRAEGVFSFTTYTKEELIKQAMHEAEEQGTKFNPETITGPRVVLKIDGTGAVVRE